MRYLLLILSFLYTLNLSDSKAYTLYLSDALPQSAYGVPIKKSLKAKKTLYRAYRHTQLAYKNPPAALIFNHPARGMKHARHEALRVTNGVPQRKILYPYYELRERAAPQEWFVR